MMLRYWISRPRSVLMLWMSPELPLTPNCVCPSCPRIMRALEKRPVGTEEVEAAMARINRHLVSSGEGEVSSRQIGELVMDQLRGLDQVAYVRFASVYREFEDVNAFREEIERLERQPTPEAKRQQMDLLADLDKKS